MHSKWHYLTNDTGICCYIDVRWFGQGLSTETIEEYLVSTMVRVPSDAYPMLVNTSGEYFSVEWCGCLTVNLLIISSHDF